MARGRFIAKEICIDKKVNDLNDPWSMLAFTWLITHADCEGRTYGDPSIVKSLVFPRRANITTKKINSYIEAWQKNGLIILYESNGDRFIEFPNFDKHQPGLIKSKEAESHIPARVTTELVQSKDGVGLDLGCVKLSEVKLSNSKDKVEVEVNHNGNDSPLGNLAKLFIDLSHIEPNNLTLTKWVEAENKLIRAGVSEDDLTMAVLEMQKKPAYKITSLQSIVTPAIQCQGKRIGRQLANSPG